MTLNTNGQDPVMLLGSQWPEVVAADRIQCMGQIELFDI